MVSHKNGATVSTALSPNAGNVRHHGFAAERQPHPWPAVSPLARDVPFGCGGAVRDCSSCEGLLPRVRNPILLSDLHSCHRLGCPPLRFAWVVCRDDLGDLGRTGRLPRPSWARAGLTEKPGCVRGRRRVSPPPLVHRLVPADVPRGSRPTAPDRQWRGRCPLAREVTLCRGPIHPLPRRRHGTVHG